MPLIKVNIPYGHQELSLDIDSSRFLGLLEPTMAPPLKDRSYEAIKAIKNPIGPQLEKVVRRGERVLLLTVDLTRPSPSVLVNLLKEHIEALDAPVDMMIGLGNHRPMTIEEIQQHTGVENVLQWDSHEEPMHLGTTSRGTPIEVSPLLSKYDKKIVVGFVEPTYLLGFTGGRKMIMPGVSSCRAIAHNHFLLLQPGPKLGVLEGNPLSEDAMEVAQVVGVDWICDAVVNPDDSWAGVFAGDLVEAHRQACMLSKKIYECQIAEKADIVVTSPGPYPYDIDMVQTKKAVVPAFNAVKRGGIIILVGECIESWGLEGIHKPKLEEMSPGAILAQMRSRLKSGDQPWEWAPCTTAYLFSTCLEEVGAELIVVSSLSEELRNTFVTPASSLEEALELAEAKVGDNGSLSVIRDGRRIIVQS